MNIPTAALELRSTVTDAGEIKLSLESHAIPEPNENEVVVRVEATPVNPSDLANLLAFADTSTGQSSGAGADKVYSAQIPKPAIPLLSARVGMGLKVGNEGAGTVVKAGSGKAASALMGRTVAVMDGAMYCQYRLLNVNQCVPLNERTSARAGASFFVNPLTALGMVETMKMDGAKGIVHTVSASNLGQMLNKLCIKDGINLVNIVRKDSQAELLRSQGAKYICNSSSENFERELIDAIEATGAYVAFDPIGGGDMVSRVMSCMERAAQRSAEVRGPYGTAVHKQLYVYGRLDTSQLNLALNVGFSFSLGGWLMPLFLEKVGLEKAQSLRMRVVDEIETTFASSYSHEISLSEALDAANVERYNLKTTGEKYLINPTLD